MAKRKKNEPITSLSPLHEKNRKPRGPKQQEIPGTERKRIAAVESAFEDYDEARAKSKLAKNAENAHYDGVIQAMRDAKVSTYKFASSDGTTVTITLNDKTKFKVHKAKPEAFKQDDEE